MTKHLRRNETEYKMSSEGAIVWAVYIHIHPAGVDSYGL